VPTPQEVALRYLNVDYEKCNGGKDCQRECELACSRTFFKTDDAACSSIRLLPVAKGSTELRINVCNQCGDCVKVCPVEALRATKLGIVLVDKKTCVGCVMCMGACPTVSMRQVPGQPLVFKCTSCAACVKVCPKGALAIVDTPQPEPLIPAQQ
jgi:anaerobic carbon-monoxide dehydrogenase iron sulfur subunit